MCHVKHFVVITLYRGIGIGDYMDKPRIKRVDIPKNKRVICISDIHGEVDLLKELLENIGFCDNDVLVILGDFYTKGSQCHPCFQFVMDLELDGGGNVHVLRGNADWGSDDYLSDEEQGWLDGLPHIIDSPDFVFVHAGLGPGNLEGQNAKYCMRNEAFLENTTGFDKWVMVGHWPVGMYCHETPCNNPIVDKERRIIAIDGGNVVKRDGQLNAFIICGGEFSYQYVDRFPKMTAKMDQDGCEGSLHITWLDRFVKVVEEGIEFSVVCHLKSGKTLLVPNSAIWRDNDGSICICDLATDHWLSVKGGDVVSVVEVFSDRMFAKLNGVAGWLRIN